MKGANYSPPLRRRLRLKQSPSRNAPFLVDGRWSKRKEIAAVSWRGFIKECQKENFHCSTLLNI